MKIKTLHVYINFVIQLKDCLPVLVVQGQILKCYTVYLSNVMLCGALTTDSSGSC